VELPFDLLSLADGSYPVPVAGCCPSICCLWRLAAAPRTTSQRQTARYFQHTVSMDVLRLDHHASDTTYVCCIPSPSRAVGSDFGIILWSNVQSSSSRPSPFIFALGCRLAPRGPTAKVTACSLPEVSIIHRVTG
jgi:hypothetical protein